MQGLTLVELMISILVSLFLIAGVLQMYYSNKETYRTTATLARLQESARAVNQIITKELRMSNHAGCRYFPSASTNIHNVLDISSSGSIAKFIDINNVNFKGYAAGSTAEVADLLPDTAVSDSEVILIKRMSQDTVMLSSQYLITDSELKTKVPASDRLKFAKGMIYIVNDCVSDVGIFQAQDYEAGNTTKGPVLKLVDASDAKDKYGVGNSSAFLGMAFPAGSELGRLESSILYLNKDPNRNTRDLARRVLYYPEGSTNVVPALGDSQSLIRGVESLKYYYGVDLASADGVADTFKTAGNMTDADWNALAVVKVVYTVSSDEKLPGNMAYNDGTGGEGDGVGNLWGALNDTDVSGLQGKIVRRFTTLVDLRNPPKY